MNRFTLEVKGLQAAVEALKKVQARTVEKVEKEMKYFGEHTVLEAKRRAPVDEEHLRNSITYEVIKIDNKITVEVIVANDYAAFVEFGTKKFAARHVASLPQDWRSFAAAYRGKTGGGTDDLLLKITEWVKRKGFAAHRTKGGNKSTSKSSTEAQENAAYVIALRILQNGIRPHPYLFPAFEITQKELLDNLRNELK